MKLNYKLWLEKDSYKVFGEGPCSILQKVDSLGSLQKAAQEFNMSYSKAWKIIRNFEDQLGFDLLIKQVGGIDGGGSRLTPKARLLVHQFTGFCMEAEEKLLELEAKWFNHQFMNDLK